MTPRVDGVSRSVPGERAEIHLLVGEGGILGTWGNGGGPTMSWEMGSSSRAGRLWWYGRCNPCILRTNTNSEMLGLLTPLKSAAIEVVEEAILAHPNVAVGKCA